MSDDGEVSNDGSDAKAGHEYEVGYRRPPKETRFVKGKSGNPRGRPKGSTSFSVLVEKGLRRRVTVRDNGVERKAEALEVIVSKITNKAMAGDLNATRFLLEQQEKSKPQEDAAGARPAASVNKDDRELIDHFYRNQYAASFKSETEIIADTADAASLAPARHPAASSPKSDVE